MGRKEEDEDIKMKEEEEEKDRRPEESPRTDKQAGRQASKQAGKQSGQEVRTSGWGVVRRLWWWGWARAAGLQLPLLPSSSPRFPRPNSPYPSRVPHVVPPAQPLPTTPLVGQPLPSGAWRDHNYK